MTLVQIAYNTVNSFNLSEDDKQQLIAMLQGNEVQERAKRKLKKVPKVQSETEGIIAELTKPGGHFKSQNGKNLY